MRIKIVFINLLFMTFLFTPSRNIQAGNYGMAGCGLGAVIMKPDTWQVFPATTNVLFYNQMFGISLETFECNDNEVVKREVEQKVYAHYNYQNLKVEIAQGQGETLTSLGILMGCSEQSLDTFRQITQSHYQEIFSKNNSQFMLNKIIYLTKQNKTLLKACNKI